ncbi:hypothetical protein A584_28726 [Pseudomonas syringae pv. theae ICMP 3923]|uniref:Uncharacterized protein n=2 Tax=Pseudomonas syringae group TaxID=136849 RepID=A0A261WLV7_9PSED|nr:hypothetical protein CT122_00930 [Pseudomonas syringae pv. actinidiae]EPM62429.1 hypothetical protein A264_03013 [Pseudomonas syringae pv. actinidiae ICMP 19071]EPM65164.1 hypothetical protein A584_28726 [Pseudomonas syringae pv. theae ICMP 3923]EPM79541.1 hypothetical protein A3SO_05890 [Pseudomonas syringae pv. actinidiae ICMP 19072]KPZ34173.1 hypothetical protein AN901_201328 [Pseudomonas syringae pv. theae]OZI87067.1 hypothetical protein CFN58_06395 [Pseudomonas avellanae]
MPDFLGYILIALVLALPLYGAFYAPFKIIMLLVNGKDPLHHILRYQCFISCTLSFIGAFCAFFLYLATRGHYEFFLPLAFFFSIQAIPMLIMTIKAKTSV